MTGKRRNNVQFVNVGYLVSSMVEMPILEIPKVLHYARALVSVSVWHIVEEDSFGFYLCRKAHEDSI